MQFDMDLLADTIIQLSEAWFFRGSLTDLFEYIKIRKGRNSLTCITITEFGPLPDLYDFSDLFDLEDGLINKVCEKILRQFSELNNSETTSFYRIFSIVSDYATLLK